MFLFKSEETSALYVLKILLIQLKQTLW